MKLHKRSRWFIYPTVAVLTFGVLKWREDGGFFSYISVCRHCGAEQHSTEVLWVIPVHKIQPTPLSEFAGIHRLSGLHQHQWAFGVGRGEGTSFAEGEGRPLLRLSHSSGFVAFLAASRDYQGTNAAQYWLRDGLNPRFTFVAERALQLDTNAVNSAETFAAWFTRVKAEWNLDEPPER